jgi:hypothetical protein
MGEKIGKGKKEGGGKSKRNFKRNRMRINRRNEEEELQEET